MCKPSAPNIEAPAPLAAPAPKVDMEAEGVKSKKNTPSSKKKLKKKGKSALRTGNPSVSPIAATGLTIKK